ncbi:MAG: aldo/keto reductase [Desulfomonilaceae bacterium]
MKEQDENWNISRRDLMRTAAAAGLWLLAPPAVSLGAVKPDKPLTRVLGRTGFEVTTLGLGGQASLQWTPPGEDPERIIQKAVDLGINYFDTSNLYGPSQLNYGKAFRTLHLIPGASEYDEAKRRSIFLASKTGLRYAKGQPGTRGNVASVTNGPPGSMTLDDLKRTLSQIFGDGQGNYPPGAYLDLLQIHNLTHVDEVDAIFEGLETPDPKAEWIGALAALRDYRDGTNLTGLNTKEEKLIRHIGITGHFSSPVLMECLQRDTFNVIDTLLVAMNANDRRYFNHQYNVIPVAAAKNVGIIAMKVFADGAMYGKGNHFSRQPADVVRTVGSPAIPSAPLIRYTLSTPGIATAIIGIGHIDSDRKLDQLEQNLAAAKFSGQINDSERREIEQSSARAKDGMTNYFQREAEVLSAPRHLAISQKVEADQRVALLSWQTAYAGDQPLSHYEIRRDDFRSAGFAVGKDLHGHDSETTIIGQVEHRPQTTMSPFTFQDRLEDQLAHRYRVITVDASGRMADSEEQLLPATG